MPKNPNMVFPTTIAPKFLESYRIAGVSEKALALLRKELALPSVNRLSTFARPRRVDMLTEAVWFPKGQNQDKRIMTELYKDGVFVVAVGKPGKEAAPDFKRRHYKTGVTMNNANDMNPSIIESGKRREDDLTFSDLFEQIEHLMRADLIGLELLGTLIFRMAFMLDHKQKTARKWRYEPPEKTLAVLRKRIPSVGTVPVKVFLYFLDVLALNEDVKVHTLGHENAEHDYGRINTLLTFAHLIGVLLNRCSLAKFAGAFARPPAGMAPLPKIKGLFGVYPLLTPLP